MSLNILGSEWSENHIKLTIMWLKKKIITKSPGNKYISYKDTIINYKFK